MFDPNNPLCPVCGGEMWDNRAKKTNTKAPDFRCKDEACKFEWDKTAKTYTPSEYTTAVWLPKGKTPAIPVIQVDPIQVEKVRSQNITKAMDRKEESIAWSNAKNNATQLVCHVNIFRMITDETMMRNKIQELADWFFELPQPPFKN